MEVKMEVKVFKDLEKKDDYKYCIKNREVEFENIIKVLNGSITLEGKDKICEGEPLLIICFKEDKDTGSGDNPVYVLKILKINNEKVKKEDEKDKTIKIKKIVKQDKYLISGDEDEDEKYNTCESLFLLLKEIIEPMLPTLKTKEKEPDLPSSELDSVIDEAIEYEDSKRGVASKVKFPK